MPAVWNEDDFSESGLKSIEAFTGKLYEVEEDIENDRTLDDGTRLTGLQTAFHWEEVEDVESPEPVKLEGGKLTSWVKQKSSKNSTFHRMFKDWSTFAQSAGIAPLPSGLFGKRIRWERKTYSYGADFNPGRAFVPVSLVTIAEAKRPVGPPVAPSVPSDKLQGFITDQVGEDGATLDIIRRAVVKAGAKAKKAVEDAGGLESILEYIVGTGALTEADGYYTKPGDDLPF